MVKMKLAITVLMVCVGTVHPGAETCRDYLQTGNWYPPSVSALNEMLDGFFGQAQKVDFPGRIRGLVVPHAGFAYSGRCAAQAYSQLENIPDIRRVLLLGVSHRANFYGACVSDFSHNATPLGRMTVDREITARLAGEKLFRLDNRIMQYEHSLENQLPFLQRVLKDKEVKIVPILFGGLKREDFEAAARAIGRYVDEKTLVVASSDFTHFGQNFGYMPFKKDIKKRLTALDMGIIDPILTLDFEAYVRYKIKTGITMCGFTPVGILMKLFSPKKHEGKLMSYYRSGDFNGDYSLSVSYASIIISEKGKTGKTKNKKTGRAMKLSPTEKRTLIRLARDTLKRYLEDRETLLEAEVDREYPLTENLKQRCGVFVTLKKDGQLRGCIGSLVGEVPLYQGVMKNALNAALRDPRFPPVEKSEFEDLEVEISVMTPLQRIEDYKKIRLGTDGVIIRKGYQQAVYLPQVASETGWNLDQFLASLCRKAGLPLREYRSGDMDFYIFQALVFQEKEADHGN
jgi:hypothetical protein